MTHDARAHLHATFARYFSDAGSGRATVSQTDLTVLSSDLPSALPATYAQFLLEQGPIYCPTVLRLTMEFGLEHPDLRQFLTPAQVLQRAREGWKRDLPTDLFAFATDCMGNLFCFPRSDERREDAPVLFLSAQQDEPVGLVESFDELLAWYIEHAQNASAPLKHCRAGEV